MQLQTMMRDNKGDVRSIQIKQQRAKNWALWNSIIYALCGSRSTIVEDFLCPVGQEQIQPSRDDSWQAEVLFQTLQMETDRRSQMLLTRREDWAASNIESSQHIREPGAWPSPSTSSDGVGQPTDGMVRGCI